MVPEYAYSGPSFLFPIPIARHKLFELADALNYLASINK